MTKPRNYQTEAIIIRKTKLGEADRILTLYTPYLGKIQAVAKGVRRPKSKMAGHLELLSHSLVSLARGKNLDTVTGSQTITGFLPLKSDLWLTASALYAIELVDQFAADNVENYPLFRLLLETMQRLSQSTDNELVLRYYELHLLEEVGYRPQLQQCVSCGSTESDISFFSPDAGGVLCPVCSRGQPLAYSISPGALKVLRLLQGSDYRAAGHLRISPSLSVEVDRITKRYIRHLLEREIRSAAWLNMLKEQVREGTPGQIALL